MSNAIRGLERKSIRNKSKNVESFRTEWDEYREKKWDGNVPKSTARKKLHFADGTRMIVAELRQASLIKQALALKIEEKLKENRKKHGLEEEVEDVQEK